MSDNQSYNIAGAIVVIGLAFIGVFAYIKSNGEIGSGFGFLSGMCLFFWSWQHSKDKP